MGEGTCSFFLEKKKEPKNQRKIYRLRPVLTRIYLDLGVFLGIIYWEGTFAFLRCLSRTEPAALTDAFVRGSRKL